MMAGRGVDSYALLGWVTGWAVVFDGGGGHDGLTVYALCLADDGRTCAACECGTAPMAGPPTVAVAAAAAAAASLPPCRRRRSAAYTSIESVLSLGVDVPLAQLPLCLSSCIVC
eukprot:COSAG01_NODE_42186_length_442_cov_2.629738_1_plen_114_part_00